MDIRVLDHPRLPLLAPLDDPKEAGPTASRLDQPVVVGGPPCPCPPGPCCRAGPGPRVGRCSAARRWSEVPRRSAAKPGPAVVLGAGAGGHVLAVGGDLVGPTGGIHQRLERHRVHPASVVGTLARLPGPAQPGPGRPSGIRPNRRLPTLAGSRSGGRRPAQVGGGLPCRAVRGRVGTRGGWYLVGHRRRLVGQQPGGRGGTPPSDSTATSAAAAAFIVSTFLGTGSSGGRGSGGVTASPRRSWPSPAAHQPAPRERPWRLAASSLASRP